jgi:hypothetical protein
VNAPGNLETNGMTKSFLIACTLACFALDASAQVGFGGGAVGSLGSNGSASSVGGLGSGIRTGTTSRGADLRDTGQIDSSQTPATASLGIDARTNGSAISADTAGSVSTGTPAAAPPISGSTWGGAPQRTDK